MAVEDGRVDESSSALTGAFSGAVAGASIPGAGPVGAVIGGVIGAGIGIFTANKQNKANKDAQRKRNEAIFKASVFKNLAVKQAALLKSTGRNLDAASGTGSQPAQSGGGSIGSNISQTPTSAGTF